MAKKKCRPGRGREKGNNYERQMCKRVSLWVSDGVTDELVWRTDASGSRATNRQRLGHDTRKYEFGDMKPTGEEARPLFEYLCWELRSRARFEMFTVFGSGKEDPKLSLLSSWAKACAEADCSSRRPVLITHANGRPDIIWVERALFVETVITDRSIRDLKAIEFRIPEEMTVRYDKNKTYTFRYEQEVVGVNLAEWLFEMDPEVFIACVERYVALPL